MSADFIEKVQAYNAIVKDVYEFYIENVAQQMRLTNYQNQEQILSFSGISFIQSSNPSISPFASVSGLTHEQYMSNYNLSVSSWDLAYDLDLSSHIVPFVDMNVCDSSGTFINQNIPGNYCEQ
jgi:hypothetical protein